ncbi:MAG TPA: twin-arginine translocase TatA/TatE family subunit [Gammaproteobacteria bacterium]|nr:twin-arginine translocase TatA/TatE family subunit [Gammaproteobacteria bacterium]
MNIGFSGLLVILVVALLVIKPEQLPEIAVAVGRCVQKAQRFFAKIKKEVNHFVDVTDESTERQRERK